MRRIMDLLATGGPREAPSRPIGGRSGRLWEFRRRCIPSGDAFPANSAIDQPFFCSDCDSNPADSSTHVSGTALSEFARRPRKNLGAQLAPRAPHRGPSLAQQSHHVQDHTRKILQHQLPYPADASHWHHGCSYSTNATLLLLWLLPPGYYLLPRRRRSICSRSFAEFQAHSQQNPLD